MEAGRPFVIGPREVPSWNLAQADGLVVCGVSAHTIGVDVEPWSRGEETLETANKVFSERENAELLRLAPEHRARRAVELWTVKEAYLKARGEGIGIRLDRFTVAPDRTRSGRYVLADASALGDDPLDWQLGVTDITASSSSRHVLALAVRRGRDLDLSVSVIPVVPA